MAKVLQVVNVTIIDDDQCKASYKSQLTETMFCAGDFRLGRYDACVGDSGGPLVYQKKMLIGIVSWGKECGKREYPGVYTDIRRLRSWIDHFITDLE